MKVSQTVLPLKGPYIFLWSLVASDQRWPTSTRIAWCSRCYKRAGWPTMVAKRRAFGVCLGLNSWPIFQFASSSIKQRTLIYFVNFNRVLTTSLCTLDKYCEYLKQILHYQQWRVGLFAVFYILRINCLIGPTQLPMLNVCILRKLGACCLL